MATENELIQGLLLTKKWNDNIVKQLKMITEGKQNFKVVNERGDLIDVPQDYNKGIRFGVTIALNMIKEFPVQMSNESENIESQCPECHLNYSQEELDTFGGVCEDCYEDKNQD
ncbi:hypothetical protein QO206_03275 [Leeuwenhoekiella aequorea]|uniref:hypothetical protein n=1 Tax=Leeuwenhoekiella aequorea TaxID=283736 RepID=UPI00352DEFE4|tara:strand:+ start:10015 stop:10356 length:342 start_codon:yes stop_codon:yes gene_type:complete